MPTTYAETFASKLTEALQVKPRPFVVDGKEVATVTAEGHMALVSNVLTADEAKDLRGWIKTNFMSPTL